MMNWKRDPRTTLTLLTIVALLAFTLLYAYFQARAFLAGPLLTILSPQNGLAVASTSPEVVVRGSARNISFLTVNELQIFTNEQGEFARIVLLANGYNVVTIEARDKFNRSVKKELQLFVK